jgi:hypothetical protein
LVIMLTARTVLRSISWWRRSLLPLRCRPLIKSFALDSKGSCSLGSPNPDSHHSICGFGLHPFVLRDSITHSCNTGKVLPPESPPCTPVVPPRRFLHCWCGIDLRLLAVICWSIMSRPSVVVSAPFSSTGVYQSIKRIISICC